MASVIRALTSEILVANGRSFNVNRCGDSRDGERICRLTVSSVEEADWTTDSLPSCTPSGSIVPSGAERVVERDVKSDSNRRAFPVCTE